MITQIIRFPDSCDTDKHPLIRGQGIDSRIEDTFYLSFNLKNIKGKLYIQHRSSDIFFDIRWSLLEFMPKTYHTFVSSLLVNEHHSLRLKEIKKIRYCKSFDILLLVNGIPLLNLDTGFIQIPVNNDLWPAYSHYCDIQPNSRISFEFANPEAAAKFEPDDEYKYEISGLFRFGGNINQG